MADQTKFPYLLTGMSPIVLGVLAVGGLLVGAKPVSAQTCTGGASDPDTCRGNVCVGTLFGGRVVCTANDVRIGFADNVRDPVTQAPIISCFRGSTLTFQADFHVELTAQERFDIGLYFATDGDPNDNGARTGECSVSKITAANNDDNFINLDDPGQPGDTCGDINAANDPQVVTLTLSAECVEGDLFFNAATGECQATAPSPDAPRCMSLPNCTSWRQTGANDVCNSPLDAFPGTTSKCNCDDTFGIPVIVETPSGAVNKTAIKAVVTYQVSVTNNSSQVTVEINSLVDNVYGDLATRSGSTCSSLIGTTVAPGATSNTCEFTAEYLNPGTVGNLTNTVTAVVEDTQDPTNTQNFSGSTTINVNLDVSP